MSRDVTLRARLATACAVLRGRPSEAQRVDAFVTAIRSTAPQPATRPLAGLVDAAPATRPLVAVRSTPRTDTVLLPRIIATAGGPR